MVICYAKFERVMKIWLQWYGHSGITITEFRIHYALYSTEMWNAIWPIFGTNKYIHIECKRKAAYALLSRGMSVFINKIVTHRNSKRQNIKFTLFNQFVSGTIRYAYANVRFGCSLNEFNPTASADLCEKARGENISLCRTWLKWRKTVNGLHIWLW